MQNIERLIDLIQTLDDELVELDFSALVEYLLNVRKHFM